MKASDGDEGDPAISNSEPIDHPRFVKVKIAQHRIKREPDYNGAAQQEEGLIDGAADIPG